MKNLNTFLNKDDKFTLPCLLCLATATLDCYLTSKGLKQDIALEGNFYYQGLYQFLNNSGIYTGKLLALTAVIGMSIRENNPWPINLSSLVNTIGAGSWILASYLV